MGQFPGQLGATADCNSQTGPWLWRAGWLEVESHKFTGFRRHHISWVPPHHWLWGGNDWHLACNDEDLPVLILTWEDITKLQSDKFARIFIYFFCKFVCDRHVHHRGSVTLSCNDIGWHLLKSQRTRYLISEILIFTVWTKSVRIKRYSEDRLVKGWQTLPFRRKILKAQCSTRFSWTKPLKLQEIRLLSLIRQAFFLYFSYDI